MAVQGGAHRPHVQRDRRPDTAAPLVPERATLVVLRQAAARCRACPLWEGATQTVFGEGERGAKLMLVGEQPGDKEDKAGRPFVGPAGKLLDRALAEVGLDRRDVYVTNVVKHFKWQPRGARRIHDKPAAREIAACRPWLEAEIAAVHPVGIVCLGATAAQALIGPSFRVTVSHGELLPTPLARFVTATLHPSALLRAPDEEQRREGFHRLVTDLAKAAAALR